jgi:hypothetical protein
MISEFKGIDLLDYYFEIVGGYTDGSLGSRLHSPRKSLTDLYTQDELKQLLSEKKYERYRSKN